MVPTEHLKRMQQLSLAETGFLPKAEKQTRKAVFLAEMDQVVPWSRLEELIEPFYPKKGNGRLPMPLDTMLLRIHFGQWLGYSDPSMEEASHKRGTVVHTTLIAALISTKNEDKKRDPEMTLTKKSNQWQFGMKAHTGVDLESGLVHVVECTTAKVADIKMMGVSLHGEGKCSG